MPEFERRYDCLAIIGSMTQAMRAQKVLANAAVRAEVIKVDSALTGKGCAYAVSYSCLQADNVKTILKSAGIRVRNYYDGDAT